MPFDSHMYVHDILTACLLIEGFTAGLSYETYASDALRVSAVERQLSIIGEAVSQLIRQGSEVPISGARRIVGFRNILIHNYARVSQAVVWTIVQQDLPVLKAEAARWLERQEKP